MKEEVIIIGIAFFIYGGENNGIFCCRIFLHNSNSIIDWDCNVINNYIEERGEGNDTWFNNKFDCKREYITFNRRFSIGNYNFLYS